MVAHANTMGEPVIEIAAVPEVVPGLGPPAVKATRPLRLDGGAAARARRAHQVGDLLESTLQETGYFEGLEAERTIEAQGRLENLHELIGVAREFDANWEGERGHRRAGRVPSAAFALLGAGRACATRDELVTLMTLHNAKGLEYPVVFMIGCEEGVFPHSRSIDEGNLEEERRLCYVGITRAEQKLYITYARTRTLYGARSFNMPSRFIDELPAELTDAEEAPPADVWEAGAGDSPDAPLPFRVGDDVVHATFGEGVVTGIQQGGVVTVHFAAEGRAPADGRLRAAAPAVAKRTDLDGGPDHRRQGDRRGCPRTRSRRRWSSTVERFGEAPGLATVLVGDDPASKIYVGGKHRASDEVGIRSVAHDLPATPPRTS